MRCIEAEIKTPVVQREAAAVGYWTWQGRRGGEDMSENSPVLGSHDFFASNPRDSRQIINWAVLGEK